MIFTKKILAVITVIIVALSAFAVNGDLQYLYGYNYSKDASTTFQGIKSNISVTNKTDKSFFKFSVDFFSVNGYGSAIMNQLLNTNDPLNIFSYIKGLNPDNINVPFFFYIVNEAYGDIYLSNITLRAGRFAIDNGASVLYCPSVPMQSHNYINPFTAMKTLALDGISAKTSIGDFAFEGVVSPRLYDDIPALYAPVLTTKVITGVENAVASATAAKVSAVIKKSVNASQIKVSDTNKVIDKNVNMLDPVNANASIKTAGSLLGVDFKAGYTRDHYHFMVPEKVEFDLPKLDITTLGVTLNSTSTNYYAERNNVTFELQGVSKLLKSVSYHADADVVIPQKNSVTVTTKSIDTKTGKVVTDTKEVEIFDAVYVKAIGGAEFTYGEDFTMGAEGFNGLPNEEFKGKLSLGGDLYCKTKVMNIGFEGLGLLAFTKINDKYEPGYSVKATLSYRGIDNFEPSLSLNWAHADNSEHSLKAMELTNSIGAFVKIYF